ncbi:MAG: hypothetical protein A2Y80_07905 [Deltaproteobacteria bacterium RBG_13_58_19]|nr:MAG: hypothetical protein A2Y80_07905 [Deltaproteobacteria bacterium RBG_13_58_19]
MNFRIPLFLPIFGLLVLGLVSDLQAGPYFLLVSSTSENLFRNLDAKRIGLINASPYQGIAVRVSSEFDEGPLNYETLKSQAQTISKTAAKAVWPWIFLNRIVGNDDPEGTDTGKHIWKVIKDKNYFRQIKGLELEEGSGALTGFYDLFRSSLKLAKLLSAPGIVFDLEPYNCSPVYQVAFLAKKYGLPPEEIIRRLQSLGKRLTAIAAEEYPDAVIWFLFTYLGREPGIFWQTQEYQSVAYIVLGMLEEAAARKLPLRFVSGGEVGLGYCSRSLEELQGKIRRRAERFAPLLAKYPALSLGGTIAPWNDRQAKRGWMAAKACGQCPLQNLEDFAPFIGALAANYDYLWIYATLMAGYNPFDAAMAGEFHTGLAKSFQEFRGNPQPSGPR